MLRDVVEDLISECPAATPVLAAIHHRRSIREGYDKAPIHVADVERVVAAGLAAPSSKNSQPWRLHVVNDLDTIAEIANDMERSPGVESYVPHDPTTGSPRQRFKSTVRDSAAVLRQVPVAIFIENAAPFSDGSRTLMAISADRLRSALFAYGLEYLGIGAALQNMWLAAESLGLRAAFIGDVAIATPTVSRLLRMSGDLVGVLALGRSSSSPRPPMDDPNDDPTRVVWFTPTSELSTGQLS